MLPKKSASVLSGVNAQTKRGSYPYVQMFINSNVTIVGATGNYPGTIIMGRGMTKTNLSTNLNSGKFPNCDMTLNPGSGSWENPTFNYELKNIYLHFTGSIMASVFQQMKLIMPSKATLQVIKL